MIIGQRPAGFIMGLALSMLLMLNGYVMAVQYCPMKPAPTVTPISQSHHSCCAARKSSENKHRKHCNGDCCKDCKILFHAASALRSEKCAPYIPAQILTDKTCDLCVSLFPTNSSFTRIEYPPGISPPIFMPLRI